MSGTPAVTLAHHWLVSFRGGEIVLAELAKLFPGAPIHTLVATRGAERLRAFDAAEIHTSPLQLLPGATRHYRKLLPLHPAAIALARRRWRGDFALSSDASMIKAVVPEGVPHVCYCHSPPRYLWDMRDDYARTAEIGAVGRRVFNAAAGYCRDFDRRAARHVTHFIANSAFVQKRIADCYGRDAAVIHPPCHVNDFNPARPREAFYLLVSQLTPYKRADIAVRACTQLRRRLVVVGVGAELGRLRRMAGPTVEFRDKLPRAEVVGLFERCAAFLYPQVEDFGITAVEAQAAGAPVIAFRAGGALESVVENETGWFFDGQNPEALAAAIERFEAEAPGRDPAVVAAACRANAERFRPEIFRERIASFLAGKFPGRFKEGAA